jgi:hypothetical protein
MFGIEPKLPTSIRIFGEMEVITTNDDIKVKLMNRGLICMFVGYSVDHANDVYRIMKLNNKRFTQTRDVFWQRK